MQRNKIEEEEPQWVLNDDLPIEYPEYVRLLLDTGLRLGLPCEKVHALFQISGDWKLRNEAIPCTGGSSTRSQETESVEEHIESEGEFRKVDVLSSSVLPVCESFENPSKMPSYCAHLQRESAAMWMEEGPASLPAFHYCRKAVKRDEEGENHHSRLGEAHSGSSEEKAMPFSTTTTTPSSRPALDCLYCFHEQLFKEETDSRKSKKGGIRPVIVVETLAEEALEETRIEEEEMEGKCEGGDDSITSRRKNIHPPSSSALLRHYHTHRCRSKKVLAMLEEKEEKGEEKETPGNNDSTITTEGLSVEAVAESESRHCTFVCAAGTSITPVVVTYCAECEMFGPLTQFQYNPPFDEKELDEEKEEKEKEEKEEGDVEWDGTERNQRGRDKKKSSSSSSSQNPSSWISTDPSSIIAARLMLALYVLQEALPDIMNKKTLWDACSSYQPSDSSLIPSSFHFSPSLSPIDYEMKPHTVNKGMVERVVVREEEEEEGTRREANKAQRATKVKEESGRRSKEAQAEGSSVGNSMQGEKSSPLLQGSKSVDLRGFLRDPSRPGTTLTRSKYLFLPTPLLFQDPPPSLKRQTSSFYSCSSMEGNKSEAFENLDQGRDILDEQGEAPLDPRLDLTETFENKMESILCMDAILPGACWVRVHNREHTSDLIQMMKRKEEEEMVMVGRDGEEEEGMQQDRAVKGANRGEDVQDPSHFPHLEGHHHHHDDDNKSNCSSSRSSKEGNTENFLLYLSSTSNPDCTKEQSPIQVIPWKEEFAWEEGEEKKKVDDGEGQEDTLLLLRSHHHHPKPLPEGVSQDEIHSQDGERREASCETPPLPWESASPLLSSSSASTSALLLHDVVVGMLVEFFSPDALGRCVEEALVPQIQREEKEKEGGASGSLHHHRLLHHHQQQQEPQEEQGYYPLPYRATLRPIFHPDEERWIEAVVLYHENYSYPMKLEEDVVKEEEEEGGTCRERSSLHKERWLGDDKNGFRRACLSHTVPFPFSSDEMRCHRGGGGVTLFPTSQPLLPIHYFKPGGAPGHPLFTSSQKEKMKNGISGAEEEKLERQGEEEGNGTRSLSSSSSSSSSSVSSIPLLEDPQLILTTNHPFSIEAQRVKVLISAVVAGQAIWDALLQMS